METLPCLHSCSSQATINGFMSHPRLFLTPNLCNRDPGLVWLQPTPKKPLRVFIIFTFCMKKLQKLCTRQERPSVLGKKLFWSFIHFSSSSVLSFSKALPMY